MLDLIKALQQIKKGHAVKFINQSGIVSLKGNDNKDFIQRLSTNDINMLSNGPITSCFTNNKGRIIDHCTVFSDNSTIILVSSKPQKDDLATYLNQLVFIEDLVISDISDQHESSYIATIKNKAPTCKHKYLVSEITINNIPINIWLTLNETETKNFIDDDAWQAIRIAAMLPQYPNEINHMRMPQEINLTKCIAINKGCYIGQEVLSKAQTYQKNKKQLCGIKLSEQDLANTKLNDPIEDKNGNKGVVTSVSRKHLKEQVNTLAIVTQKTFY